VLAEQEPARRGTYGEWDEIFHATAVRKKHTPVSKWDATSEYDA
jgi:hypothetical protein